MKVTEPVIAALARLGWSEPKHREGDGVLYRLDVRRDGRRGWVTVTPPQTATAQILSDRFRFAHPGIAPLIAIDCASELAFVLEEMPDGPIASELEPGLQLSLGVGRALLRTVMPMHAAGEYLGGIRAERVVLNAAGSAVLAPRAEPFAASARPISVGIVPLYPELYLSRELLMGQQPGPPADIFAIATVIARLATGRHPFGQDRRETFMAIAGGRAPHLDLPGLSAAQLEILLRALSGNAADRPAAAELTAAL